MTKNMDAFSLKWFTVLLMCSGTVLGNIAVGRIEAASEIAAAPVPENAWSLYYVGFILYQMAFPLAAFLLVEAAYHTGDKRGLFRRLLFAALLAELPLDLVQKGIGEIKNWGMSQNYFFTLALGMLVLLLAEWSAEKFTAGSMKHNLMTLVIYLAATWMAGLLHLEQGGVGILMIVALYLFRGNRIFSLLAVLALYALFMGSYGVLGILPAVSLLFTWLYNGTCGLHSKKLRILLYAAYPVVCCVYGLIMLCLKGI